MRICQWDRDVLAIWEEHGIPDDRSTQEAALQMLWRLWEGYQELERVMRQLADGSLCFDKGHTVP